MRRGISAADHHHGRAQQAVLEFEATTQCLQDDAFRLVFARLLADSLVQVGVELLAHRIELFHAKTAQEIKDAFATALKADGPTVIAIPIAHQERLLVPPVE